MRAFRAVIVGGLTAALVGGIAAVAAAQDTGPVVTVVSGPTTERTFVGGCSDVAEHVSEADTVVVQRDDATDAVTVLLQVTIDDDPPEVDELPFEVGEPSAELQIGLDPSEPTHVVDATITVLPGTGYAVGSPSSVSVQFVHVNPTPVECGFFIDDRGPILRTIDVGGTPARLIAYNTAAPNGRVPADASTYRMTQTAGRLPPGLTLAADGSFVGRATTPGRYEASVQACRSIAPGTCVTSPLTIEVRARTGRTIPVTGSTRSTRHAGALGLTLVGLGALLVATSVRRRA